MAWEALVEQKQGHHDVSYLDFHCLQILNIYTHSNTHVTAYFSSETILKI
jgi:hypothetical protein